MSDAKRAQIDTPIGTVFVDATDTELDVRLVIAQGCTAAVQCFDQLGHALDFSVKNVRVVATAKVQLRAVPPPE